MTMVEEIQNSLILVIQSIYRLSGGAIFTRGSVANFTHETQSFIKDLP